MKTQTTYIAKFADGTTAHRASRSAKGFTHAVRITTRFGGWSVSFSSSLAGINRVIKEWRDAGELESFEIVEITALF